jgi:hypothetical protein
MIYPGSEIQNRSNEYPFLKKENKKLREEIERLREALREIAHLDGANIPNGAAFSIAIDIAQSALGEGKE